MKDIKLKTHKKIHKKYHVFQFVNKIYRTDSRACEFITK